MVLSTHSDLFLRSLINITLENKVNNKIHSISESDVGLYYFDGKKVESYNNLLEVSYFENFDDTILKVQNDYNDLLDNLYEKENTDEANY